MLMIQGDKLVVMQKVETQAVVLAILRKLSSTSQKQDTEGMIKISSLSYKNPRSHFIVPKK